MKVRFVTNNKMKYSVPYVNKKEDKNVNIRFTPGSKQLGKIVPAYYETSDEAEIEYLRKYSMNGINYEEVKPKKAETSTPEKKAEPSNEEVKSKVEAPKNENPEPGENSFPEVTTAQLAQIKLKKLDDTIKSTDVNSKEKVLAKAAEMGVSFPNLK